MRRRTVLVGGLLVLGGCQTGWPGQGPGQGAGLATADQTMDVEAADRANRFGRLAGMDGIAAPRIEQVVVPAGAAPGAGRPIPVIRVVFGEGVFFAPGAAAPRAGAARVMELMAQNMRRDVPDVRLTVLGHTDAVGSDASNYALSEARAVGVLQLLVNDGVNPGQLGTVAIGKTQPVAPNSTAAGRALNRRVEFLISPSEQANLAVVEAGRTDPRWLELGRGLPTGTARPREVRFLKPGYTGPADFSEAPMAPRQIALRPVGDVPIQVASGASGRSGKPEVMP